MSSQALAQQNSILFKSGNYFPPNNVNVLKNEPLYVSEELVGNHYYRLVHFSDLPTNEEKLALQNQGVRLLNYIPHNAFFAEFSVNANVASLASYGIRSVEAIDQRFKLSNALYTENYPHWTLYGTNQIELYGIYFDGISEADAVSRLKESGVEIIKANSANTIHFRASLDQLDAIYNIPSFSYFEALEAPGEPENIDGRTNHRSNMLATDYASGLQYDGTGVTVMMQDDGYIGDHIDYQGRIDQSNCNGCSTNDANDHGDHVAGTIMGAGNLNPRYEGMASGAFLLVYNSSNANYDDVPNLYNNEDLVITSKSYSAGCNGGYDSRARQLDQQIHDYNSLMHVFSAGNSGTSNCGYGAGSNWGNITGGHKSAKNVICVGNLTATDALNTSSSRGPATDGRIKPDICGVGTSVVSTVSDYLYESKTGTSMSCPGVAGVVTQLYHAYKDANGGANPNSALIKAAILNTAEDLGNPGPDFKHGWGRINAIKSHELISQDNYITASISQGDNDIHNLSVPAGVTKLKIMVYWADYEGTANASIALVNDLNMQVTDPGMVAFDPWVLDPSPNATTLDQNAVRAVDNLNNMEQVTIDNPIPGNYSISIDGFAVPQGPQEYFIVYEFERDEVLLTYPVGGEGLEPGTSERIRWDASEGTTPFTLEYSTDNGANWNTISNPAATARFANWSIPNVLTGEALVRITRGAEMDESDEVFSIIRTPDNLGFGWACPDSLNFTWDAVSGATSYEVYMLGNTYMDAMGTTTATNFTLPVPATDDAWFSVRSFGPNGARSERAVAIRKTPGEFGCTWSSPYANITVDCDSISTMSCVQALNQSINTDAGSTYQWYFPNGTPATSTDENPTVCYSTAGFQDASLVVTNSAGSDSVFFQNYVFVQLAQPLPYFEGFENIPSFIGQSTWSTFNADNNNTFLVTSLTSLSGTKCARLSNHGQSSGSVDELISGPIDLSSLDPNNDQVTVSFRYSHRQRNSSSDDGLRFFVKGSCDGSWTLRKVLQGVFLSDLEQNAPWTPTDTSHWTTVHVTNVTSTFFTGDFRIKFRFQSGDGNNFYLDNINIYSGSPSNDIIAASLFENEGAFEFSVYPNPTDADLNVHFNLQNNAPVRMFVHDVTGKVSQQLLVNGVTGSNLALIETEGLDAGVYFITLEIDGQLRTEQFIVK